MSDLVADFISREERALADLENNDGAEMAAAPIENGFQQQYVGLQQNGFLNNAGDSGVDLSSLEINDSNVILQNGRGASPASINSTNSRSYASYVEKEEPENIKKWRENQKKMIEEKDIAEEKKKEELRAQAKKELQEWHQERKARLEKRKTENQEREAQHLDENSPLKDKSDAYIWERVAKMVDSGSKTSRSTKDISRMKAMILNSRDELE